MRNKKFFDGQQASQYLRHCVIRIADEPVYVYDVTRSEERKATLQVSYCKLTNMNGVPKTINVEDESIDMNPVKLGMVHYFNGEQHMTFFASRLPVRKWKVGLSSENLSLQHMRGRLAETSYIRAVFPAPPIVKTIKGEFYSPADCTKEFRRYGGVLPISNRFAMASTSDLYFKDAPSVVGRITKDEAQLNEDFTFLKEVLEEDLNVYN